MNHILFFESDKIQGKYVINSSDYRFHHIKNNLRAIAGNEYKVAMLNHGTGKGLLESIDEECAVFKLSVLDEGSKAWCSLCLALCRPPSMKKVFEHASTMGVGEFHLVKASLSDKSFLTSKVLSEEEYQKSFHAGLSQSALYYQEPSFYQYASTFSYLEEDKNGEKYILTPTASKTFKDINPTPNAHVHIAIGPERDWTQKELDAFIEAGYTPIKISRTILRVEHAVFQTLGQLELYRMRS